MPGPDGAAAIVVLNGQRLRIVNVDGRVPRQVQRRRTDRARHVYLDDEIAHFDWEGHRYALAPVAATPEPPVDAEEARIAWDGEQMQQMLTNRELQIVQLVCMGLLTKQIADRLRLSEFTVRSYLKTIYCKLGVRSRGAMVYRYAQALAKVPT